MGASASATTCAGGLNTTRSRARRARARVLGPRARRPRLAARARALARTPAVHMRARCSNLGRMQTSRSTMLKSLAQPAESPFLSHFRRDSDNAPLNLSASQHRLCGFELALTSHSPWSTHVRRTARRMLPMSQTPLQGNADPGYVSDVRSVASERALPSTSCGACPCTSVQRQKPKVA